MLKEPILLCPSMPLDARLEWAPGAGFERLFTCSAFPEHIHNSVRRPLRVILPSVPLTDFVWTVYNNCLVSREMAEAITEAGIVGINFQPVKTFGTSGIETESNLLEMVAIGWGGMVAPESQIKLVERCPYCGRTVYSVFGEGRLVFDIDEWDGSDYFFVWPFPLFKCISQELFALMKVKAWTGAKFIGFEDWRPGAVRTVTPGLVRSWVAGDRSKVLEQNVEKETNRRWPDAPMSRGDAEE